MERERNPLRGVKIFFIGYFVALILVLTFVGVMNWLGYKMADMTLQFALFGLLVCSALAAGAIWIVNRLRRGWVKMIVGTLCGLAVMAVAVVMMAAFSMLLFSSVPAHYATLTSPAGGHAVVLRSFSQNQESADARAAIRRAADPESDPADYVLDDLAYEYAAYPRVLRFFYNSKRPAEGAVEIGCASEAELVYEWQDETLHLYIENPQEYDQGECFLTLP